MSPTPSDDDRIQWNAVLAAIREVFGQVEEGRCPASTDRFVEAVENTVRLLRNRRDPGDQALVNRCVPTASVAPGSASASLGSS